MARFFVTRETVQMARLESWAGYLAVKLLVMCPLPVGSKEERDNDHESRSMW